MTRVKDKVIISDGMKKRQMEVAALFNTGATYSYMREGPGKELGYIPYKEARIIPLAVEGKEAEAIGYLTAIITMQECELYPPETVEVVRSLRENLIIGYTAMEKYGIELDVKRGKVKLRKCPPEVPLI